MQEIPLTQLESQVCEGLGLRMVPNDTGDIVRQISDRPPAAQGNTYGDADQERKQSPEEERYASRLHLFGV